MSTNEWVLDPDYALRISEKLFRVMLPQSEAEFREELQVWHPALDANQYLVSHSFPRCWVVTASLIFATAFTEYAQVLLDSLRQRPDTVREIDLRIAHACGPALL